MPTALRGGLMDGSDQVNNNNRASPLLTLEFSLRSATGSRRRTIPMMGYDETDDLPDKDEAKEFYAKYEPKEVLGRGVSSTVRRCVEKTTNKEYAVKIIDISTEKMSEHQASELYTSTKKEVTILKECAGHKHIIELHDAFKSPTFFFLVFELCTKGELFDFLTQVVALSEKRTRLIMRQLLEAVEFIHEKGIVHRDLKPENILLDEEKNVKLSDFGFATFIKEDTQLQDLCGTPGYFAPEMLQANMFDSAPGYGRQVDMWACGVIMYTLLVGCPPFWHRKQMMMIRAIMNGWYTFDSPEWDDISESAKDIISKLLVIDPASRFTAQQTLAHPFFSREKQGSKEFFPRKQFKAAIIAVSFLFRLKLMHLYPPPISMQQVKNNPYSIRALRKIMDNCAFKMYGHWVKRGDDQNRAALFEMKVKRDLKNALMSKTNVVI